MCFKFFSWKIIFYLSKKPFKNNFAILESKIIYFSLRINFCGWTTLRFLKCPARTFYEKRTLDLSVACDRQLRGPVTVNWYIFDFFDFSQNCYFLISIHFWICVYIFRTIWFLFLGNVNKIFLFYFICNFFSVMLPYFA